MSYEQQGQQVNEEEQLIRDSSLKSFGSDTMSLHYILLIY